MDEAGAHRPGAGVADRAAAHAALGDPGRLRVVDALGAGDRSPGDLARELEMPASLLTHHLRVLRDAGLVEQIRSESDRRRRYVRVVPAALSRLTMALAPQLPQGRVVFVCTANSARSQLAAALWADRVGPAASAGTRPAQRVHPGAVAAAARHGLQLLALRPARLEAVLSSADTVVTVCDAADRALDRRHVHWSVPDPVPTGDEEAFEAAYRDLAERIRRWLHMADPR